MFYTARKGFDHDRRQYRAGEGPIWFSVGQAKGLKAKGLIVEYRAPLTPPQGDAPTTFICVASGPSLTPEDCDMVRAYREQTGAAVIAVNLSFRRAPWADYLYAMDREWWRTFAAEVKEFAGRKICPHVVEGAELHTIVAGNSGAGAMLLAASLGAKRIILLGYDCQHTGGFAHWHEDYPKGMGNAGSVKKWPGQFAAVSKGLAKGVEVVNASRESALALWPRVTLEEALA